MSYVVLTALKLKSAIHVPAFLWHTLRSARQARNAPGNISVKLARIDGRYCTVSVWRDREAIRAFARSNPHRQAVKAFPRIATAYIHSFEGEPPPWDMVVETAQREGRAY